MSLDECFETFRREKVSSLSRVNQFTNKSFKELLYSKPNIKSLYANNHIFWGWETNIRCVIQPHFSHRLAGRKRVLNLSRRLSSVVVSSLLLTQALQFSHYSRVNFLNSENFLWILTAMSNVLCYALMQITADKCVGNFTTFSVSCRSIKLLCTKFGPKLYIFLTFCWPRISV